MAERQVGGETEGAEEEWTKGRKTERQFTRRREGRKGKGAKGKRWTNGRKAERQKGSSRDAAKGKRRERREEGDGRKTRKTVTRRRYKGEKGEKRARMGSGAGGRRCLTFPGRSPHLLRTPFSPSLRLSLTLSGVARTAFLPFAFLPFVAPFSPHPSRRRVNCLSPFAFRLLPFLRAFLSSCFAASRELPFAFLPFAFPPFAFPSPLPLPFAPFRPRPSRSSPRARS